MLIIGVINQLTTWELQPGSQEGPRVEEPWPRLFSEMKVFGKWATKIQGPTMGSHCSTYFLYDGISNSSIYFILPESFFVSESLCTGKCLMLFNFMHMVTWSIFSLVIYCNPIPLILNTPFLWSQRCGNSQEKNMVQLRPWSALGAPCPPQGREGHEVMGWAWWFWPVWVGPLGGFYGLLRCPDFFWRFHTWTWEVVTVVVFEKLSLRKSWGSRSLKESYPLVN